MRLRLSAARRGEHRGILHFVNQSRTVFVIDRRDGWYVLPESVGVGGRAEA